MKQIIVLVSMIILGIAIAGMVLHFQETATDITEKANSGITKVFDGEWES